MIRATSFALSRPCAVLLMATTMLCACQENKEPTTTLTQGQWEEVRQQILDAPPAQIAHPSKAVFGDKIAFLGLNVEPANAKAGQELTLTWLWQAKAEMDVNYQVFVHFDHKGAPPARQGMDHHPVRDLYQTSRWKAGQIIKDVQKVRLRADYPDGDATFWMGFWDPATGQRLSLSNPDAVTHDGSHRVNAATIKVSGRKKASPSSAKAPLYEVQRAGSAPTIDGQLNEEAWEKVSKAALGGTRGGRGPGGETWVKVLYDDTHLYLALFAQDNDAWGSLKERDADTWTEEVVEIFIDPNGDAKDYIELQITPNNVVFDARFPVKLGRGEGSREEQINGARAWNSNLQSAVYVDGTVNDLAAVDKSWSVEVKIPFADLPGGAPKAGAAWKANFYRFDAPRDSAGKVKRQIAWAWTPPAGSFHNVERYGTLRFKPTAPVKTPPPKPDPNAVAPDIPE